MNRCDLLVLLTSKNVQKKQKEFIFVIVYLKSESLICALIHRRPLMLTIQYFLKKNKKLIKPRTNIMSQNLVYAFAMTEKNETEAVNNVQKYQNIQPFCFTSPFKIPC